MKKSQPPLKTTLLGATGNVGSRILTELLDRGHEVTAIVRDPEKLPPRPGLNVKRGDVSGERGLAQIFYKQDAVISAVKFHSTEPRLLARALKKASVNRLLMVGGAGSLEVSPGVQLMDMPDFPEAHKPEALAGRYVLSALREERDLNWTFLSPSASLRPGERTGTFRHGTDQLLVDENGESTISIEDYAVALVDELETPQNPGRRFTVGY
jgi:putative NADH-flavin reductase